MRNNTNIRLVMEVNNFLMYIYNLDENRNPEQKLKELNISIQNILHSYFE